MMEALAGAGGGRETSQHYRSEAAQEGRPLAACLVAQLT